MGRKKIVVKKIEDERHRHVTFVKRKSGVLEKAMELSLLCDCEVALIIFEGDRENGVQGKLTRYSSTDDIDDILVRLSDYVEEKGQPDEQYTNTDYNTKFAAPGNASASSSSSSSSASSARSKAGSGRAKPASATAGKRKRKDSKGRKGKQLKPLVIPGNDSGRKLPPGKVIDVSREDLPKAGSSLTLLNTPTAFAANVATNVVPDIPSERIAALVRQ